MKKFFITYIFLLIICCINVYANDNVNADNVFYQKNLKSVNSNFSLYEYLKSLDSPSWVLYEMNNYSDFIDFLSEPTFENLNNNNYNQFGCVDEDKNIQWLKYADMCGYATVFQDNYEHTNFFIKKPFIDFMKIENLKNILSKNNDNSNIVNYSAITFEDGNYMTIWVETEKSVNFIFFDLKSYRTKSNICSYDFIQEFNNSLYEDILCNYKLYSLKEISERFDQKKGTLMINESKYNSIPNIIFPDEEHPNIFLIPIRSILQGAGAENIEYIRNKQINFVYNKKFEFLNLIGRWNIDFDKTKLNFDDSNYQIINNYIYFHRSEFEKICDFLGYNVCYDFDNRIVQMVKK